MMEIQNNNDFKYIIQDTSFIYFGKELTYSEMMDLEETPFKWKTIVNGYISKDADINQKMTDHILTMTDDEFSYRIFDQLKMKVRICYKVQKKGFGGKSKDKWVHQAYPLRKFCREYRDRVANGEMMIEDISISKLALMGISI